jgi:hypothetical protein
MVMDLKKMFGSYRHVIKTCGNGFYDYITREAMMTNESQLSEYLWRIYEIHSGETDATNNM